MNSITCLAASRKVTIDGIVLAQKNLVQLTDEVLSQRHASVLHGLFHHFHTHLTGLHVNEVLQVALAAHLSEKQQKLGLSVGQRIALNVVAVEVVFGREFLAQQLSLLFR